MKKLLLIGVSILTLAACGTPQKNPVAGNDESYQIVTTFPPLYSFTESMVGDNVEVTNLVPAGVSVHTWEPKPTHLKALENADVLVMVGLGLEPFVDDMIEATSNPNLKIIQLHEAVEDDLQPLEAGMELEEDHGHEEGGLDPHIWLDPVLAKKQVEFLRDQLGNMIDSQKAEAYLARLDQLNQQVAAQLQAAEKKNFILFHDAYGYFLKRYNLEAYHVGSIEPFPGKEPSLAYLNELIQLIQKNNVKAVFTEPQFSPKVVESLKDELGIESFAIDPIGAELTADGYENNVRAIANQLVRAFQ